MFPGLNGEREQPVWLRHVVHCRPIEKAAFALGTFLGRAALLAHALPALPVVHPTDLGVGTQLSTPLNPQPVSVVTLLLREKTRPRRSAVLQRARVPRYDCRTLTVNAC